LKLQKLCNMNQKYVYTILFIETMNVLVFKSRNHLNAFLSYLDQYPYKYYLNTGVTELADNYLRIKKHKL